MRRRYNFIHGTLEEGISETYQTLHSQGLAQLPEIADPDYVVIILDPSQRDGDPEIAYVVDHALGDTTATIQRGKENSIPRSHNALIPWVHGMVVEDLEEMVLKDASVDFTATPEVNGEKIWHEGNDGSGSGLDADKLDGYDSSDFARTYVHYQPTPIQTWFIQHNLGRFPGITVVDSAGSVVVGDIQYNDNSSVTIYFSAAFAGKAYLD